MVTIPDYVRGRFYLAAPVVAALLSTYGLMEQDQAELWLGLAAALLFGGNLLAAKYTPQRKTPATHEAPSEPPNALGENPFPSAPRSDALDPRTQPVFSAPSIPAALLSLAKDLADGDGQGTFILPGGRTVQLGVSIRPGGNQW